MGARVLRQVTKAWVLIPREVSVLADGAGCYGCRAARFIGHYVYKGKTAVTDKEIRRRGGRGQAKKEN